MKLSTSFLTFVAVIFGVVLFIPSIVKGAQGGTLIHLTVLNPVSTSTYYISVVKSGTGSGVIISSDGLINCGTTCFEDNIPNASSTLLTAVADSDSYFTGWSVGGNTSMCSGTSACIATSTEVITAEFNLIPVPPPQPSGGTILSTSPVASPSGLPQFFFENFRSGIGTTSTIVSWYTTVPALSTISWGNNSDGDNGSGAETAYSNEHSIELDNLSPNTSYILNVDAQSKDGRIIYTTYSLRTLPISNSIPLNISNFTGQISFGGNILLQWQNPFQPDFKSVIITRGTRFFPRDPREGYLVYQGGEEAYLDTNVIPGQQYYYSAFVTNTQNATSSGTLLKYGLPFATGLLATSTSLFGGTPISSSSTSSSIKVNYIQNDQLISESNNIYSLQASIPTLIDIPFNYVPQNVEETTVTVGEGTPSQSTFIFQKQNDGSLQASIPAILPTGPTHYSIDFLQVGSDIHLSGTFVGSGPPAAFVPQSTFSYVVTTYVMNNFVCTTLPICIMFFEIICGVLVIAILLLLLFKKD